MNRDRALALLALPLIVLVMLVATARQASAHPLDRLRQHVLIEAAPLEVRFTIAMGGGLIANERLLADLDPNGDGVADPVERQAWLAMVAGTLTVRIDDVTYRVSPENLLPTIPDLEAFHVGTAPVIVQFTAPVPNRDIAGDHRIDVRNQYLVDWTDHQFDLALAPGATAVETGWPGPAVRVVIHLDPALATEGGAATATAWEWAKPGAIARAERAFTSEHTPQVLLGMLGLFVAMGALHALQPGHGKTLVAAYLVATGGTSLDALVLAAIVTFTHTISVFLLGGLTLALGHIFMPSRVIPLMTVLSGLLVAGMGVMMLRNAVHGRQREPFSEERLEAALEGVEPGGHTHDHAALTDEEHARVHLEEAMQVKEGVSFRSLLALGVSGGLVPCPDALAILLLAIGLGQAGLGMVAIVAFSLGLAAVLIAFGLVVALAGPAWSAARQRGEAVGGPIGRVVGGLVRYAQFASAAVVLLLGLAMTWRAIGMIERSLG